MNILMIASECEPYAKTGGLADVVGALPSALQKAGHQVAVVIPKYASIDVRKFNIKPFHSPMGVWMGNMEEWCSVHRTEKQEVPIYLVESNKFFNRYGLYHDGDFNDYQDNPRRFGFLTRAALQLCHDLDFKPDVVHAHDWQAALAAAYLKIWHWNDPILGEAASVLTIHNLAYQGVYSAAHYDYLGLQWMNFTPDKLEDHGRVNFLKGGIVYSDFVNTVSPSFANETRSSELGFGLAPYLNDKGDRYVGILNGVDYNQWNPEIDKTLPARYSVNDLSGKRICKAELQKHFLLDDNPDIPIIGVVSRLVPQKGLDLLAQIIESIVNLMNVQFVILGAGEKSLEAYFGDLPRRYPGRISSFIGYNDVLAHWIEAGSDFFIMPSIYEPCGLNQIYSLKYGTLPIVRATGGLEDSVIQYNEETGEGTGFKFYDATPSAIYSTVGWAVSTYYDRKAHLQKMIRTAMEQDFSWEKSARDYEDLYQRAIAVKKSIRI
jgi:starch synthase